MPVLMAERAEVALACRVLAARDLASGFLGHISRRIDAERVLVRCRGVEERGLAWTEPDDIRLVTLDGKAGRPGELDGWSPPNELPLHTVIYRRHPEALAVVHAHPEAVVAADLAGLAICPIVGAYDIHGAKLTARGIPVYPRSVLIRDLTLATEMADAMGEHQLVLLRGHGLTTRGASVPEAVLDAVSVDRIARLSLAVSAAGGVLRDIPAEDLAQLPDLGGSFNVATAWRHEVARLG